MTGLQSCAVSFGMAVNGDLALVKRYGNYRTGEIDQVLSFVEVRFGPNGNRTNKKKGCIEMRPRVKSNIL